MRSTIAIRSLEALLSEKRSSKWSIWSVDDASTSEIAAASHPGHRPSEPGPACQGSYLRLVRRLGVRISEYIVGDETDAVRAVGFPPTWTLSVEPGSSRTRVRTHSYDGNGA
ncbi:hypothetical protein CHELA40_12088 [Chelatococcus asaccharovorans]|nr:hypothetical protein CHELA40_12088 [Chelatococcus asaccharovorans]CAH1683471.1 hypothetical protein CHELA17_63516 [Chelatococcus asaccharovorans]